jgi:NADPH-ferrihemoprotein reductase
MESSTVNMEQLLLRRPELDDFAFLGFVILLSLGYCLRGVVWNKPDPYHHMWFEKPQAGSIGAKSEATRDIGQKLEQTVSTKAAILWHLLIWLI